MSRNTWLNLLLLLSSLFLIIGIVTKWIAVPLVITDQVHKNLELIEGTKGYEVWLEPPNEIYIKYYFFHVLNPDEIKNGSKPKVQEVGPYVYKEKRKKQNVVAFGDEELQYGQWISYTFDQEQTSAQGCFNPLSNSTCTARDNVTVINAALVGILDVLHTLPGFIKDFAYPLIESNILDDKEALYPDDLFHTFAVDDILWQGFEPGIIKFAFNLVDTIELLLQTFGITIDLTNYFPPQLQDGTLAFFRGKNATDFNSFYKINRGRNEKHKYCMIEELNGKDRLPSWWWPDLPISPTAQSSGLHDTCHMLKGTDGVFFPSFVDKNYPLWLYVPDLCRSVFADYESEVEIKGIDAWRFRANLNLINYTYPENLCFCPAFKKCAKPDESGQNWNLTGCEEPCLDGILHASGCLGVPVLLSAPHFYNADPILEASVDGMNNDIEKHDTYLDIEPITGITLSAHKRGQINVQLRPVKELPMFEKVPKVVFPVFWADETATLDDENAKMYKGMVKTPLLLVDIFVYLVGFGFGCLGILIFVGLKLCFNHRENEEKSEAVLLMKCNNSASLENTE